MGSGNNGALINSSLNPSTFGGPVNLSTGLVYIGGTGPIIISGPMTGAGGVYKIGFDSLTLSGNESFLGGIDVTNGLLSLTGTNLFKGGVSINGGTLAVNSDSALGDTGNIITLNVNGTFQASGSFITTRTFNAVGGIISVDANQILTLNGSGGGLTGTGPFNALGAGTLRLTTASPFNGQLVVANGTFSISNTSGALPNVMGIDLRTGGTLELNSSTSLGGNQTNNDRINNAAGIIFDGGTISLLGADNNVTTELLGALNISSGSSTIQVSSGSNSTGPTAITFSSLFNRSVGATVAFIGTNLGTSNKILFASGVASGQPMGGWATVNGTDFAKYDSTLGVIPFASTDYSINTFTPGSNVYLDPSYAGATIPNPVPAVSIATLNINASAGAVLVNQSAGSTLTLTNSGLIKSGSNPAMINNGILTSTSGELDVLVSVGTLTIGSQLSGNFVLTERGSGILQLNGAANNNYTGVTVVSGTLQLNNSTGVSVPGNLIINGGLVTSLADRQFNTSSNVVINSGEWDLHGHNESINSLSVYGGEMLFNHGTLNVSSGVTLAGRHHDCGQRS